MSNKKRKKNVGLSGTFGVPVTPTEIKNPQAPKSRADLLAEIRAEEETAQRRQREIAERPLRELEHKLNAEIIAERDKQRKWLFVAPCDFLQAHCTHTQTQAEGEIRVAFNRFCLNLAENGVTLHQSAIEKFRQVSDQNPTIDLRIVPNWETLYSHMDEYGVFTEADRTVKQEQPIERPAPVTRESSVDELETICIGAGTESERRAKRLVNDALTEEFQPIFDQYRDHLVETFGFYTTHEQFEAMKKWWNHNPTLDPRNGKNWSAMRLSLIRQGILPASLKTADENLQDQIEATQLTSASFETRRNLNQALKNRTLGKSILAGALSEYLG
jgi:hypothetical protein